MLQKLRNTWNIIKHTIVEIFERRVLKLSAALAYYTIFSLPGLLIIIIWISDFFYGRSAVEGTIYGQIRSFIGDNAAETVQHVIRNAALSGSGGFATTVGIIVLAVGATSVFAEMQDSLNILWRLKPKPRKGRGWLKIIINRLLSFSMVISLGFLMLVSLIINGLMDVFSAHLQKLFPQITVYVIYVFNFLFTLLVTTFLFGMIFKLLPDADIEWKQVRVGAFTTAVLFMLGKFLIGYYLGQNRMSSAYGAAGSVIVMLLWVYYSSAILYTGAVFTRLYAIRSGAPIYPSEYAVRIQQVELEKTDSLREED